MRPPRSHPTNTLEKSRKHGTYLHCKQTPKRQKTLYTICFRTTAKQHGGRQNGLLLPLTCVFPRVFVCFPVCSAAQPRTAVCSLEAAQQQQQQHKKRGRNNIYSFVSSSTPRRIVQTRGHRKPNEWRWPGPNTVCFRGVILLTRTRESSVGSAARAFPARFVLFASKTRFRPCPPNTASVISW